MKSPGKRPKGKPAHNSSPIPIRTAPAITNSFGIAQIPARSRSVVSLVDQLTAGEEIADFERGGVGCIGTVYRVAFDRARKFLADRPFIRLGRIGGPHQRAPLSDSVGRLQHERNDGSR